MIRTILRKGFSTASDLLSSKNINKFLTGEFPEALNYSRPFSMHLNNKCRCHKIGQWHNSSLRNHAYQYCEHFSFYQMWK